MKFGCKYLVDSLSEEDKIWQIDRWGLAVHNQWDRWTLAQRVPGMPKKWRL